MTIIFGNELSDSEIAAEFVQFISICGQHVVIDGIRHAKTSTHTGCHHTWYTFENNTVLKHECSDWAPESITESVDISLGQNIEFVGCCHSQIFVRHDAVWKSDFSHTANSLFPFYVHRLCDECGVDDITMLLRQRYVCLSCFSEEVKTCRKRLMPQRESQSTREKK